VVGRDLVLTAAHCVTEYVEGRIEPSDVIFLAGYRDGQAFATAQATRIVPATNRPLDADDPSEHVRDDWALIELDQPIGLDTGIVPVAELTGNELDLAVFYGTAVTQAGYSGDRPERLTGHQGCRLLGTEPDNWVLHDCDIVPGDSGSPLLIERGGQLQLFAVATAMLCSGNGERTANSAVDARAWGAMFRRMTDASGGVAVRVATPGGQSNRDEQPTGNGPRIVRIPCDGC
jgi:protease YdgD